MNNNSEKSFMDLFEEIFGHPFDLTKSTEGDKEKEDVDEKTHEENLSNLFDTIFGSFQSSCSSKEKEDTEKDNNFYVVEYASKLKDLYDLILKDIITGNYTEERKNEDIKKLQTMHENASKSISDDIESHKTADDTEEDFDRKEAIRKNLEAALADSCSCPKIIICCPDNVDKILDSLKDIKNLNLKDFHETVSTIKATDVTDLDKRVYGSLVKDSDSRCEIHYHDLEQKLYIACNDLEELQRAIPVDLLYDNHHGYTFNYSQGVFFYIFSYDNLVKFDATTVYHI